MPPFSRRAFLQSNLAGVLGLSLPQLLRAGSSAAPGARAKNVLVILEQGGLSHLDTWDPKPDVIAEHRSPYRPIATNVPGMRFTELLTRTSRVADKLAVVRSMRHLRSGADDHPRGTRYVLSGAHPISPIEWPDLGSAAGHVLGSGNRALPPYIMVPGNHEQAAEAKPGFLPTSTRAFKTGGRDVSDPSWRVGELALRNDLDVARLDERRRLIGQLDAGHAGTPGIDRFYDQAFDMLRSSQVSRAIRSKDL